MDRDELIQRIQNQTIQWNDIPHLIELFTVEPQLELVFQYYCEENLN